MGRAVNPPPLFPYFINDKREKVKGKNMGYIIKTERKATIIQKIPGARCVIDRRIYEDELGREFVRVNGDWFDLDWYDNDNRYEVQRYWVGK